MTKTRGNRQQVTDTMNGGISGGSSEFYTSYDYCQKFRLSVATIYLNLESGKYGLSGGCRTEETITAIHDTGIDPAESRSRR